MASISSLGSLLTLQSEIHLQREAFLETFVESMQVILAVTLIGGVLLQSSNASMGGAFGQSDSFHSTRRGLDRLLFNFTISISILFFLFSVVAVKLSG